MSTRKIEALRRLAERPGTEAEGIVAREMLKRFEAKAGISSPSDRLIPSLRDLLRRYDIPDVVKCPCGEVRPIGEGPCTNVWRHLEIQTEIRAQFKKGDVVFYNYHAYPKNCPGVIAKYVPLGRDSTWHWISVKFGHLKHSRQVPIIDADGKWCLTKEPV